jgi:DNA-3-methyladenine glycosylase I
MSDRLPRGVVRGDDDVSRCFWCTGDALYRSYHDREWGFPVADDQRLFEKIALEGFQAGLSWLTILRKRENFRRAFHGFEIERVARMGARDVLRLLGDASIVRHRGKIEAAIANAKRCLRLIERHGSLASFVWRFEPAQRERPRRLTRAALLKLTQTPTSAALSKALRAEGFQFVGPTTMYAFMQAMGLVNDHLEGCAARDRALAQRTRFRAPETLEENP